MKIRTQLRIVLVVALALIVMSTALALTLTSRADRAREAAVVAASIARDINEQRVIADEYLLYREERTRGQWQSKQRSVAAQLESLPQYQDVLPSETIDSLQQNNERVVALFEELVALYGDERAVERGEYQRRLAGQLLVKSQSTVSDAYKLANIGTDVVEHAQRLAFGAIAACIALLALQVLFILSLFRRNVVTPLIRLREGANTIATGNLSHRVDVDRKDELGELATSFNAMAQKLSVVISSLQKERAEATAERNRLAVILAGVSDAVIALDENHNTMLINPAAEELLHINKSDAVGKSVQSIVRFFDGDTEMLPSDYGVGLTTFLKDSARMTTENGIAKTVRMACGRVNGGDAIGIGVIITIHDLTKELESERAKSQFITVAAHQMRTPLTGISWALTALDKGELGKLTKKQKLIVSQSLLSSKAMASMANDLLTASDIEARVFTYELRSHDFSAFVHEIVDAIRLDMQMRNISCTLTVPKKLPPVAMDAEKMRIAYHNLIENAVNYSKEGGAISVTVALEGGTIETKFTDNGIGIPAEEITRLFAKFYRGTNATRYKTSGNGLGLYLAKTIVENHRGTITATSTENVATTFTVTLPVA